MPNAGGVRQRLVLIVDDHPLLREGLTRVIDQQADFRVCAQAADGPAALTCIARTRPEIVIIDISLDQGSGLELIKDIHALYPRLPLLALSMHPEHLYAERALRAGALGYVMKREPVDALLAAMRKVLDGHLAVSEAIASRILNLSLCGFQPGGGAPADVLSDREIEIFRLLGEGLTTREIAARLRIAFSTVETYRATIKRKLHLQDAAQLVSSATRFVASESPP